MKRNGMVIPHEHGGWAMASVPFLFGMIIGQPRLMHIPLFIAWLLLYLSSYPLLQALKRTKGRGRLLRWGAIYGGVGAACLVPPLLDRPALLYLAPMLVALLLVNIGYVLRKNERAIINDLCAVLLFSLGGAGAYILGDGEWGRTLVWIVLFSFLHFAGSAFFVKTMFRERGNRRWVAYAKAVHLLILIVPSIAGNVWMTIPYLLSVLRTWLFAGKSLRPMMVGIIEIVCVVQFLIVAVLCM